MSGPENKRPADRLNAYGWLGEAVYELATGRGRINERLEDAFMCVQGVRPEDFPERLRGDFVWIMDAFRSLGLHWDEETATAVKTVESALSTVDENLAVEIARRMIALESRMGSYLDPEES